MVFFAEDPVVSIYPQIQVFKGGDSFHFVCEIFSQFPPEFTWLKDDRKIAKSPRIDASLENQIFISNAKPEDDGKYTCIANYSGLRPGVVLKSSSFAEFRSEFFPFNSA